MRVTDTGSTRNFILETARQRQQLDDLTTEMTSGRKLQRPSDDPIGAQQSITVRSAESRNTQYATNVQLAQGKLQNTDSVINSLQNTLDQALSLTTEGLSGNTTAGSRSALATQIGAIAGQVLSYANSTSSGQYIFGGTSTSSPPFSSSGGVVTYNGDNNPVYTRIDDNTLAQTNVSGQDLFTGSKDLFATLNNIQQGLNANDTDAIKQGLSDLRDAIDHTDVVRSQIGATLNVLQQRSSDIQQQGLTLTSQQSNVEDANIVQVAVQSNQAQLALQASLSAGSRILSVSLLDYLK